MRELPIGAELRGDYDHDLTFRGRVKAWVSDLWRDKDARIERMLVTADAGDVQPVPTGD